MKDRVDHLLVSRGLAKSGESARSLVMAGVIFSGSRRLDKPGTKLSIDSPLEVRGKPFPWVSRGGLKLDHALRHFKIKPKDTHALDIGASTGGFTDVLLSHGAKCVYAVDVGHGQLDWKLRCDPRVVVLEKTNARHLSSHLVPELCDLVVCDTSFISLRTVLPAALVLAKPIAHLIALIKPQFEVKRGEVGRNGVVRDRDLHGRVCNEVVGWLDAQAGWKVIGITESPIIGPKGNREFLVAAKHCAEQR
tara:strand:+ start:261 stop:1007 length:747 start_codon:yes stop_codon:yes gene_type:complete